MPSKAAFWTKSLSCCTFCWPSIKDFFNFQAPPLDQCVEAEVQPGDTLTKISLKYNIPVAELKRVNNILSEQQFYALKRIKIPVRAASLLTELLPAVHQAKGESK